MKKPLPDIRLEQQPDGLKFRAPKSAVQRWDKKMAAAKADGEIVILGEIGESFWSDNFTTAKMVKDQLTAIGKAPVLVTINSPGGGCLRGRRDLQPAARSPRQRDGKRHRAGRLRRFDHCHGW